ncbi:MAG: LCP family protein [Deltaproteobacteria bacterium]|nr:LCP family protein [Deltaproteobacteria bacterium]
MQTQPNVINNTTGKLLSRCRRHRRTGKWLRRAVTTFLIFFVSLALLLLWYLLPVLTMAHEPSSLSMALTADNEVETDRAPYGIKHLALGWFHGAQSMDRNVRVLILGFDENSGAHAGRTDVIMVVEMDPKKGVGILSVPRDLWVPVPDVLEVNGTELHAKGNDLARASANDVLADRRMLTDSTMTSDTDAVFPRNADSTDAAVDSDSLSDLREFNRINTVFRLGNRYFGKGMGYWALKKVLREELDLKVDYTVAIDYEGVRQVIDAIGGVEVDVQCPIQDNFVSPNSPGGYESLNVPAGRQILSGHQALLFMRSRHGRTDMDRSRRQQMVLFALRNQLLSDKEFLQLPRLVSQLLRFVKTDADVATILEMAVTLKHLRGGFHGLVLRTPLVSRMRTVDGKSVVVLNRKRYLKARKELFIEKLPGARKSLVCPSADVALNWRKLKKSSETSAAGIQ